MIAFWIPLVIFLGMLILSSVKVLNEYERGVVLRLGSYGGVRGPGLIILIPGIEKMVRVDLRLVTLDIPSQDAITKDNVTLTINGVCFFRVEFPEKAIIRNEDYIHATSQVAQTKLRTIIGQYDLDDILSHRDEINGKLQEILDRDTEDWGVKVVNVELKTIDLPVTMQRAMARQAEAEREKRAKVISAEGELDASKKLAEAARVLGEQKEGITLRYLDTMREISNSSNSSTNFFPFPIEMLNMFKNKDS